MQQITIRAEDAGQRFDKFLRKYFREAQSSFLYKMLRKKNKRGTKSYLFCFIKKELNFLPLKYVFRYNLKKRRKICQDTQNGQPLNIKKQK